MLKQVIKQTIETSPQQRITFAEYMAIALYHPEFGYYSTPATSLGKEGDFFTSVHLGADFGEMLAHQFVEMWELLNRPQTFTLVEMGAGQGLLALDILKYLQTHHSEFFAVLTYKIVEKSPQLQREQQNRLQDFPVSWCDLADIPNDSVVGCFFSNELVDALPVHQFVIRDRQILEIFVTLGENSPTPEKIEFTEIADTPSTPELAKYLEFSGIDINNLPDGYRSEINLAAKDWLASVSKSLQQGYAIAIDYGYPAHRYYNPQRRNGTLQCYYQHQRHDNPYINVGLQDITTHVNFTALEKWGAEFGLINQGFTKQALFLMALGLGDRIMEISQGKLPIMEALQRRDYLQQLIDPVGLGGFGVLVQAKNAPAQLVRGLREP